MNRVVAATAAALCTLFATVGAPPAGAAVPYAPALPQPDWGAQVQQATQMSSQAAGQVNAAANDAWRRGYAALPPQLRDAVPRELRPAEPTTPPAPPAAPQQAAGGEPTPAPDTCANCVAITFDDGPVGDTNRLLDTLERKQAHASFFVVGSNANANPAILRRMRDAGHTIGNHSYNHPELPKLSDAAIGAQMDDTTAAIQHATGTTPRWMRPPYGAYDSRVAAAAGARGMAVVTWNVDTADWKYRDSQRTCRVAVDEARAGSVVLMHDIHPSTVDAAECVIDGLRAKGLRPASLDEMVQNPEAGRVYSHRP